MYFGGESLMKFSEVIRQAGGKVHLDKKIEELDAEYIGERITNTYVLRAFEAKCWISIKAPRGYKRSAI